LDAIVGSDGGGQVIAYRGSDYAKIFSVNLFPEQVTPIAVA
jgi:hypothetical protein